MDMVPLLGLASNSPRRKQLLALTGVPFSVCPVDIDESALPGELPGDYVLRLAREKANAAIRSNAELPTASRSKIILTSDTTVADGNLILGKPSDAKHAREMLRSLRGRDHLVYTAISLADWMDGKIITDVCATRVWMRTYSDAEIETYISSGDPFDKAGAYAIQNTTFHPVEKIEGCYACVMGLPVCHVVRALRAFGSGLARSVADTCPTYLEMGAPCLVSQQILSDGQDQAAPRDHRDQGL